MAAPRPERVQIEPQLAPGHTLRWPHENLGLIVALLESTLLDRVATVPVIAGVDTSSRTRYLDPEHIDRRVTVTVGGAGEMVELSVEWCASPSACVVTGGRRPRPEVATLAAQTFEALNLGRHLPETLIGSLSPDPYATLITGRSAAVVYGMIRPSRPDPVRRAVFLDPKRSLAQWLLGRREIAVGRPALGWPALVTAHQLQRERFGFLAELAESDRDETHYRALLSMRPAEHRHRLGAARAQVHAGRIPPAERILSGTPPRFDALPAVLALRAAVMEARDDRGEAYDRVLAKWQRIAPPDPTPVRKRVDRFLDASDHRRALSLLGELSTRTSTASVDQLRMALQYATGARAAAAITAQRNGRPDDAAALRDPLPPTGGNRWVRLARGRRALAAGDLKGAAREAVALLEVDRWDREALLLAHHAGRADAGPRLHAVDPSTARALGIAPPSRQSLGALMTAPGRTSTASQPHSPSP